MVSPSGIDWAERYLGTAGTIGGGPEKNIQAGTGIFSNLVVVDSASLPGDSVPGASVYLANWSLDLEFTTTPGAIPVTGEVTRTGSVVTVMIDGFQLVVPGAGETVQSIGTSPVLQRYLQDSGLVDPVTISVPLRDSGGGTLFAAGITFDPSGSITVVELLNNANGEFTAGRTNLITQVAIPIIVPGDLSNMLNADLVVY